MLNELVLRTIIVKFDIIFLELEDNRLIHFKNVSFPQLHLVDLVGSIKIWLVLLKQMDFFIYLFLHNACTPTFRHKLSWLSILVSCNRHSEHFVFCGHHWFLAVDWPLSENSCAVNDHWRSRCDCVLFMTQTSIQPGRWLLVCWPDCANDDKQIEFIMLGWWTGFGFMHQDASSNCNGISFAGAFLKFYVQANGGDDYCAWLCCVLLGFIEGVCSSSRLTVSPPLKIILPLYCFHAFSLSIAHHPRWLLFQHWRREDFIKAMKS